MTKMKSGKSLRNKYIYIIGALIFSVSLVYFIYLYNSLYEPSLEATDTDIYSLVSYTPPLEGIYLGRDDAPITIVVYTGFTCEACKEFNEEIFPFLRENYINTGKARYYHKHYLTEEDIESRTQNYKKSLFLHCLEQFNEKEYWTYYRILFSENPVIDDAEFNKCTQERPGEFERVIKENFLFGINAEPSIVIGIYGQDNTVMAGTPSFEQIRRTIKEKEILLGYE